MSCAGSATATARVLAGATEGVDKRLTQCLGGLLLEHRKDQGLPLLGEFERVTEVRFKSLEKWQHPLTPALVVLGLG